jgi:hypothetical protein
MKGWTAGFLEELGGDVGGVAGGGVRGRVVDGELGQHGAEFVHCGCGWGAGERILSERVGKRVERRCVCGLEIGKILLVAKSAANARTYTHAR